MVARDGGSMCADIALLGCNHFSRTRIQQGREGVFHTPHASPREVHFSLADARDAVTD